MQLTVYDIFLLTLVRWKNKLINKCRNLVTINESNLKIFFRNSQLNNCE